MLRILGANKRFCDGLTRRDLLCVGALAPLGLTLAGYSRAAERRPSAAAAGGFGSAKRCVLLYLWGSPSQLDTFDPKPDAPPEVHGELGSIPTASASTRGPNCTIGSAGRTRSAAPAACGASCSHSRRLAGGLRSGPPASRRLCDSDQPFFKSR